MCRALSALQGTHLIVLEAIIQSPHKGHSNDRNGVSQDATEEALHQSLDISRSFHSVHPSLDSVRLARWSTLLTTEGMIFALHVNCPY